MERVETLRAVILDTRTFRELEPQIGKAGLAFVKYRPAKERVPFDVEYHFRLAFRSGEEIVCLKKLDPGEGKNRVYFCHRDHIVWNRINPKFSLEEILHHVLVTQLGDVGDAIDGVGEIRVVLEAEPVSRLRDTHSRYVGLIDVRVLVVDVKSSYPRHTGFVFPIFNCRLKTDGWSAPAEIIQPEPGLNIVCDRERDLRKKRWSPGAVICGGDGKTKRVVERLVEIRKPKHRHLPDVCGDVQKDYAIALVNTNLVGVQVKIGLRRIVRRESAALDKVGVVPLDRGHIVTGQKVRL